jgi:16S rRNA (cytosine967-C5)-methyltransferase
VESGKVFAVDLLQKPEVSELSELDRKLSTALVMGVLRWGRALDFELEQLSGKPARYFDPEVLTILRLGIYQLRFLERTPKAAVVNEAVELTKVAHKGSAAGLVNAVLRKCQPPARPIARGDSSTADLGDLEMACRSLPAWLFEHWTRLFGADTAKLLAWQTTQNPATTLRVVGRSKRDELQRELAEKGIKTLAGRYSHLALVVESGDVRSSRAFREGRVAIQDEASQLVAELVHAESGASVLDLCAAPGVKTGQLAGALGRGRLVACDRSATRLATMGKLLAGMISEGLRFTRVRLDATRPLPFLHRFDRILLDAPCSGTGTLARNPEIKWRLGPEDLMRLAEIQEKMLRQALEVLAPDGRLIYATCSLEPEENEHVVDKVLRDKPQFRLLDEAERAREYPALLSLFDTTGYFRTRPDLHSMDGFFAAVIVRVRQPTSTISLR